MKLLVLLLTALLTAGCLSTKVKPEVDPSFGPSYLLAVEPLQQSINGGNAMENICTASSINIEDHYWITAAHCVDGMGPEGRFINGAPIEVVEINIGTDIAVFRVPTYIASGQLPLGPAPKWEQEIMIVGHPLGYDAVFVTRGWIANPNGLIEGLPYMIFNIPAAPGNSGSPVINLAGEIVSVLQIGWSRGFSPVSGGAIYDNLMEFVEYFPVKK